MDSLADRLHKFGLAFERKRPPTLLQRRIVFHFGYQLFSGAGLSFLLKAVLLLFAPSVTAIYLIQLLQATSYTFLSPTQMYYARSRISMADMVKGQAFITASYTLGCAAGNFAGGQILQHFSVGAMLFGGIVMAALGTAVLWLTVERKDTEKAENA